MEKSEFYANARNDLNGPLHGVTVVEATTTWAGPMAGCVLADFGARVIKVEHPDGEVIRRLPPIIPDSHLTVVNETVNRNKENVSLNLGHSRGREIFLKLSETADIVIENFRPGTMEGWGVGYAQVAAVNPAIVYVSISAFGQFGPLSHRVGYDPIAQAFSGWVSLNGDPTGEPVKAPTYLGDDTAGLHGALGAMAALRHRDQTGEGQHVDVALVDGLLFQSNGFPTAAAVGVPMERSGNEFSVAAPANNYECRDGRVFAGVLLDPHWVLLANEMGREDLKDLKAAERIARRDEVDGLLAAWCAERTTAEVVDIFEELGLPAIRVNTYAEVIQEAHIASRDMMQPIELIDGKTVPIVGPAAKFSRTPTTIRTRAPALGENNADVFGAMGIDPAEMERLKADGVI